MHTIEMRPLLQHASRAARSQASLVAPTTAPRPFIRSVARQNTASICVRCEHRTSVPVAILCRNTPVSFRSQASRGYFHQTPHDERRPPDESKQPKQTSVEPTGTPDVIAVPQRAKAVSERPKDEDEIKQEDRVGSIPSVPAEDLPSHREARRWDLSKRLTELMDEILPKLAVVTQKVNTLTGTDYSGIEALKREIKEHEKLVKQRRTDIDEAKQALDAAMAQQASSQKEVVALLERKHSWSDRDLERYMSLIRSEHVNEQGVREAKEAISNAENALEDARAQLERRERAQYHEEQIWSDTIRRNSTWVTFGLMGVNMFLLLTSLVIFEPWRRRRMVREVKNALEAQMQALEPAIASASLPATSKIPTGISQSPASVATLASAGEELSVKQGAQVRESLHEAIIPTGEPSPATTDMEGKRNAQVAQMQKTTDEPNNPAPIPGATPLTPKGIAPQEAIDTEKEPNTESKTSPKTWKETVAFIAHDVVSDRLISMRRIDFTTAILQSAAAGAVIAAAAIGMLRPR